MQLSIIIPVYNAQDYLKQCLDSAVSQQIEDFEIICVNDDSTDDSLSILEEYSKKYDKIHIINQTNGGASVARNTGLSNAIGEYVFFFDDDDFFLDNKSLNQVLQFSTSNKLDICVCNAMIDGKTLYTNHLSCINRKVFSGSEYFTHSLNCIRDVVTPIWMHLYRRSYLMENNYYFRPNLVHEDELFNPITTYHTSKISFYNCPIVHYRFNREGSITNTRSFNSYSGRRDTARELFDHFKDIHANLAAFRFVFYMYSNLYVELDLHPEWQKKLFTSKDLDNMEQCAVSEYEKRCFRLFRFAPSLMVKYRKNKLPIFLRRIINRFL